MSKLLYINYEKLLGAYKNNNYFYEGNITDQKVKNNFIIFL
jgi:hypothetical protein